MRKIEAAAPSLPDCTPAAPPGPSLPTRIADFLWQWQHRAMSRRWLAELDARQMRDIGLTPEDRSAEARKPFWTP
ncbi:MAG: DUF1127 domain-containing protein [Acetobacteraceae bacterium]